MQNANDYIAKPINEAGVMAEVDGVPSNERGRRGGRGVDRKPDGSGSDYAHKVHEGTRRFAKDLMEENERLRALTAQVQSEKMTLEEQLLAVEEQEVRNQRERNHLQGELAEIETENQYFARRSMEVKRQSEDRTSLYVAAHQLHSTLDRKAVLGCIQDILANLVGSEHTAIFEMNAEGSVLELASVNGIDPSHYHRIPLGQGRIGLAAQKGELFVAEEEKEDAGGREEDLTACIPLVLEGNVVGAIAIFQLLPQKAALDALDHELFELLGTHAATALYCSGLRSKMGAPRDLRCSRRTGANSASTLHTAQLHATGHPAS